MSRLIPGTYDDPLDLIWLHCASTLSIEVRRSEEVFASWDGRGALTLCTPEHFDPDDSLAQMIFHELCHALIQGAARRRRVDWGLPIDGEEAALAEHACHRLQAALADRYGLRSLLAVTTDWRHYWDALPPDPLRPSNDPAVALARQAWPEATRGPWSNALHRALHATAALAQSVAHAAPKGSLWSRCRTAHPDAGIATVDHEETCGSCTWRQPDGTCLASSRHGDPITVHAASPSCIHWEPILDETACRACGACCRQGFHVVGVEPDDAMAARTELVQSTPDGLVLPRPDGLCIALVDKQAPWTCSAYADRPRACRDFEISGEHCLSARRRVGLSRLG